MFFKIITKFFRFIRQFTTLNKKIILSYFFVYKYQIVLSFDITITIQVKLLKLTEKLYFLLF